MRYTNSQGRLCHRRHGTGACLAALLLIVGAAGSTCQTDLSGAALPPPTVLETDHVLGSPDAPLTVIEYASPQCYWCRLFAASQFDVLRARFIDPGQVRWVFRHFISLTNADAVRAASAIECAADQDRFLEYHDLVFTGSTDFSADALKQHATTLGLDRTAFDACLDGGGKAARVQEDVNSGWASGVSSTPTIFVGDEIVRGFHTADELGEIIQQHLDQQAGS